MDQKNYEQISVNKEKIVNGTLPYLKDGINVSIELKDDKLWLDGKLIKMLH